MLVLGLEQVFLRRSLRRFLLKCVQRTECFKDPGVGRKRAVEKEKARK